MLLVGGSQIGASHPHPLLCLAFVRIDPGPDCHWGLASLPGTPGWRYCRPPPELRTDLSRIPRKELARREGSGNVVGNPGAGCAGDSGPCTTGTGHPGGSSI